MLPCLLAGQALAMWASPYIILCLLALFFLAMPKTPSRFRLLGICCIVPGLLSMRWAGPVPSQYSLNNEKTYLVQVKSEPRRRRVGGVELALLIEAEVSAQKGLQRRVDQLVLCRAVELPWKNINCAELGERYLIRANFRELKPNFNPFQFESNLHRNGYSATCKIRYATPALNSPRSVSVELRAFLNRRVNQVVNEPAHAALFLSMAFGSRDLLSDKTERAFKYAGLSHLLVFSGAQVMLVYYFVMTLCQVFLRFSFAASRSAWFSLSVLYPLKKMFSILALSAALFSCLIAGFEPSSLRAAISALFLVLGNVLERSGTLLDSILVSLFVLALVWPGCYFEPGVQLTYAALLGILCASSFDTKNFIARYALTCFFAWLFTSPICLFWFKQISFFGFFFNLLFAAPLAFFSCNLGYLALILNLVGIDPNGYVLNLCASVLGEITSLVIWLALYLERVLF